MVIPPGLLPTIIRQDAFEIFAAPKVDGEPSHDYSVKVTSGNRSKTFSKPKNEFELAEQAPRTDRIFTVHHNNIAISSTGSTSSSLEDGGGAAQQTYKDKSICLLLDNLNAARREKNLQPFILSPDLCEHAEFYASSASCPSLQPQPGPAYKVVRARHLGVQKSNTKIERVIFAGKGILQGARQGIRLISAEGLGALACSELWLSGKYKKHVFPLAAGAEHAADCVCVEWSAYNIVMDGGRQLVGAARDAYGRWVVELLDAENW